MARTNTNITANCLTCGNTFHPTRFEIALNKGKYCSPHCYQQRPKGDVGDRLAQGLQKDGDCLVWTGFKNRDGYGHLTHNTIQYKTHRLAYELAFGSIPSGLLVCHHCDNPACCNPEHLYAGTPADNSRDRDQRGRWRGGSGGGGVKGSQHHATKFTDAVILAIREIARNGISQHKIAKHFNVHQSCISRIVTRKRWGHIQ